MHIASHLSLNDLYEEHLENELPFIPASEVKKRNNWPSKPLWLVIDNIIYDCTSFVEKHPGGKAVLESFAGKDCSCMRFD